MGRISGYQRVRVHSSSQAAVTGHAAEGVMHALAELLDNAANFSPPTAEVHVYVEEVPAGIIVSVEDSGLVMGDVQLRRAERAVSGDVAELGGLTGTRLGLAVVGRLARKHGLKVSFRPSARGGTGVLMLIPQDILTQPTPPPPAEPGRAPAEPARTPAGKTAPATDTAPADETTKAERVQGAEGADPADEPSAAPGHRPSYAAARASEDHDPDPVPTHGSPRADDTDTGGLPRRRRGQALAAAERGRPHAAARPEQESRTPEDARARAARFSSFRQAVRGAVQDQHAVQDTTTDPGTVREEPAPHAAPDGPAQETPAPGSAPVQDLSAPTAPTDPTALEPAKAHSHPEGDTTS
jgi:anti-sigma regulatory factor (Ser/Thr protein kinase)